MTCPRCFDTGKQLGMDGKLRPCDCPEGALFEESELQFNTTWDWIIIGLVVVLIGIILWRSFI